MTAALRHDRRRLENLLMDRQFHKARTLWMDPRTVRELCSKHPDVFFSTQRGYKLTVAASDDELNEAIADLRSRVKHINERASRLEDVLRERHPSVTEDLFGSSKPH